MSNPRLLWAAPYCLHDTSSGAALSTRTILECLHERGVNVHVLSATTFDSPTGASMFKDVDKQLKKGQIFFRVPQNGVVFEYQKTASIAINSMTGGEERLFFSRYLQLLREFRPDAVMHFGGGILEYAIRAEARRRGIPTIFTLHNSGYQNWDFPHADIVLTNSQSMSDMYYQSTRINALPYGTFIRPEKVVAKKRIPKYITFINPAPEKGVTLIIRLALMAQETMPEQPFLVVQSRGDWNSQIAAHGFTAKDFPNVDVAGHMTNMIPIYEITRLLLVPSLWYEAQGRVVAEAILNGIPVITSQSGGLPETVGAGGICLAAPVACQKDWKYLPTMEEMTPWMQAIQRILSTPETYGEWCAKAKSMAKNHDINANADSLYQMLTPLLHRRASLRAHVFRT